MFYLLIFIAVMTAWLAAGFFVAAFIHAGNRP